MSEYTRRLRSPLFVAFAVGAVACGGDRNGADDTALKQDSALSRDLAMASGADSAQPALQDVPAPPAAAPAPEPTPAPAPARTAPRPTPRPAASRPTTTRPAEPTRTASGNDVSRGTGAAERNVGTIPAGAELALTSNSRVCTNTHKVGDRFTATVSDGATGSNGAAIPAGATATVEITELDRSENVRDNIKMGFRVVSVSFGGRSYPVVATTESADVTKVRNQPKSKDAQKVIGGAIAGAIAGQILGKDTKGTVIGAATGAAAAPAWPPPRRTTRAASTTARASA